MGLAQPLPRPHDLSAVATLLPGSNRCLNQRSALARVSRAGILIQDLDSEGADVFDAPVVLIVCQRQGIDAV